MAASVVPHGRDARGRCHRTSSSASSRLLSVPSWPARAPRRRGLTSSSTGRTSTPLSRPLMVAGAPAPITNAGHGPLISLLAAAATRAARKTEHPNTNSRGPRSFLSHQAKSLAMTEVIKDSTPAAAPPAKPQRADSHAPTPTTVDVGRVRVRGQRPSAGRILALTDAVLCADGPVKTLVGPAPALEHRCGHGASYDAVGRGRIELTRLRAPSVALRCCGTGVTRAPVPQR